MIELEIGNSECQIRGLSSALNGALARLMSIREEAYGVHFMRFSDSSRLLLKSGRVFFRDAAGRPCPVFDRRGQMFKTPAEALKAAKGGKVTFKGSWFRFQALMDRKGRFPTGLLYLAYQFIRAKQLTVDIRDLRIRPKTPGIEFSGVPEHPARQEQLDGAYRAFQLGRGIIVAPTGFGKSRLLAEIIRLLGVKTLIVVPTLGLKEQLTGDLRALFGNTPLIRVENVDALDPKVPAAYDCVIVDEFHHSGAATYRRLNKHAWAGVYFKFGLTATPFRSQDNERLLLESVLSKVIYRVEYEDAVKKGYIVPMEAYYVDLPAIEVKGQSWQKVYKELVVRRLDRNQAIIDLLYALMAQGKSTLCLVKEIEHGKYLKDITDGRVPFANGEDGKSYDLIKSFCAETALRGSPHSTELPVLIGTEGVLGEGVDTRPAEYVIIAGLGKSKNAFMQKCGRGFRRWPGKESCKVILFRDSSHRWTLDHFKAQVRYLKEEYGIIPAKLDLS